MALHENADDTGAEGSWSHPNGALSGIKVVDLSRVLAGPYCTMILADHGADIFKVEPPQGDETRNWGPPFLTQEGRNDASYFLGLNRSKRSLALDLSHSEGRAILLKLLTDADVLVENFKPGTMARWGLDYHKDLEARFPQLIHCRVSGFGADGPLAGLPGYDAALQAMTGLMSVNGSPEAGPTRLGCPVVDLSTGLYSAIAILMALHERTRSGRGQFIDMTLHDCALAILHPQGANYLLSGKRPLSLGNSHPNLAPCEKLKTRDGEIFIAVGNDVQFRRLASVIRRPELSDDPRFKKNSGRVTHMRELASELQRAVEKENANELAEKLLRAGIPAGAVLYVDVALAAPHVQHRSMLAEVPGQRTIATPIKFSRSQSRPMRPAPAFGEHSKQILMEHGMPVSEELVDQRVGIHNRDARLDVEQRD